MPEQPTGRLRFCTACGAAAGSTQFCTACGASLQTIPAREPQAAPPSAPAPAPVVLTKGSGPGAPWSSAPQTPVQEGRPRRSRALLPALVAVVLLVGLGVGGAFWLLRDDEAGDGGAAAADTSPTADPSEEGSPLQATPTPTPTPTADPVRCWDDSTAAVLRSCPRGPEGVAGLEWVFPGLDRSRCPRSSADRELLMQCPVDGRGVRLNFSDYGSFAAAKGHYDALTGDDAASPFRGDRLAWYSDGPYRDQGYKGAIVYVGEPFAVSIYAPTAELRDQTMDSLRMRPKSQLRGVRVGS